MKTKRTYLPTYVELKSLLPDLRHIEFDGEKVSLVRGIDCRHYFKGDYAFGRDIDVYELIEELEYVLLPCKVCGCEKQICRCEDYEDDEE